MRHIDLLCHLTARATGDAQFGLAYDGADAAAQARVEPLSRAAAHLGRATAHYTLASAPAVALTKTDAQATPAKQPDTTEVRSPLSRYVHDALGALSNARACLTEPQQPSKHTVPTPPPSRQPGHHR
ncbi:hypothetical protein [Streptomyces sp. NPDC088789]|uniref:hypothetical protein n=1 Tax=Streptomyces sp. NPDC088789 TaxID=3365899 RepID=UPI003822244F